MLLSPIITRLADFYFILNCDSIFFLIWLLRMLCVFQVLFCLVVAITRYSGGGIIFLSVNYYFGMLASHKWWKSRDYIIYFIFFYIIFFTCLASGIFYWNNVQYYNGCHVTFNFRINTPCWLLWLGCVCYNGGYP